MIDLTSSSLRLKPSRTDHSWRFSDEVCVGVCVCVGGGLRWAEAYILEFERNASSDFWPVLPG